MDISLIFYEYVKHDIFSSPFNLRINPPTVQTTTKKPPECARFAQRVVSVMNFLRSLATEEDTPRIAPPMLGQQADVASFAVWSTHMKALSVKLEAKAMQVLDEHEKGLPVPAGEEAKQTREKKPTVSAVDRRRELMETYKKKALAGSQSTITQFLAPPPKPTSSSITSLPHSQVQPRTYLQDASQFLGFR